MGPQIGDDGRLRSLFAAAVNLSPGERHEFLHDPSLSVEIQQELKALLDADGGSETFLRTTVASEQPAAPGIHEHFGPYETREILGKGGMGVVFKAERVDGELRQTVAIKAVRHGWIDPRAQERFRNERQLLAGLVHGNIAQLLDGGTREDGIAYLVMEFVDGVPVDKFCEQHKLDIAARLRLFLPLCDAVDYAHRKLIVHRDLKPSNVMVTAEGNPKLLDFGIAQTLETAERMQTGTVALTPEFASPEQARGGEVTTATDVYGLGGVLYFLLTEHPPHVISGRSLPDLQRAICEEPPQRPSLLRPELKGDLENILLKSLHVDPLRRYHSAREFAEEIERYLSHRPVRATPDGWGYRTRRFIQRHQAASAAGALAVLAVAGGTAASLYEAHLAQQRFAQVRQLANRFVFDFEAEIRNTPGTLKARRMVAATARENLASLVSDSSRDQGLNRELAESYYRLSGVESSAGENDTSIEHLKRSLQIQKELRDDCCGAPAERLQYVKTLTDLAYALESSQTPEDSFRFSGEALALARDWNAKSPGEPLSGRALLSALSVAGSAYRYAGKYRDAKQLLEDAVNRGQAMLQQRPQDEDLTYDVARAEQWLAEDLANTDGPAAAGPAETESKTLVDSLLKRNPENTKWRALRIVIASNATLRLKRLQGKDPALQEQVTNNARDAYTLARANMLQNPGDGYALDLAAVMAGQLANQLMLTKKMDDVLPLFQEAEGMINQLLQVNPSDRRYLYMKAGNLLNQGVYFSGKKNWQEDGVRLDGAQATLLEIRKKWPGDLNAKDFMVTSLLNRTSMEKRLGHMDQARETCRQGLELAAELIGDRKGSTNPVTFLANLRDFAKELEVPDPTLRLTSKTDVRTSR